MLRTRLLATACAALFVGPALARPFTAQDLVSLDRLSDPRLSPDGTRVAFDIRRTDLAANKGVHALATICLTCSGADAAAQPLDTGKGGATNPRWSADGTALYFLSSRSGSPQVWRVPAAGGVPTQVTALPLPVGAFAIAPDGRTLVVSQPMFPDCDTPACTADRQAAAKKTRASGQIFEKLFVRHWDEWADGTRNHLFALPIGNDGKAGTPRALTPHLDGDVPGKPFGGDEDFAISPDSRTLIFSARIAGTTEPWSTNFDLFQVPLDGGASPRNLTAANPAWDAAPVFSPDGKQLAYKAMRRPGFEADRFGLMLRDLASGATRELDAGWDRSIGNLAWGADNRLYVTVDEAGRTKLFRIDPASGARTALTQDGDVTAIGAGRDRLVYARNSLAGPTELFAREHDATRPLTHERERQLAGVELAPYEQFAFPGWNNEAVHGYVMKPHGYAPGKKYPVAFLIHGGPQGSFGDAWGYRWNPQFYAGLGFAVVFVDFHGSTGYGQGFTDSISGHWGDRPLEDLKKGWAAALQKYDFLDGSRACALGASYGGFMTYWIAGVWNAPWRCLVDHDGVFDNRMMGYATEELWFSEWENGHATPWQDPNAYERFNPINRVKDWSKPILVIHGAQDFRIPLEQGLAAFTAAQRKGVPSEFLMFPDENHWVLKPQNSLLWHKTVGEWLTKWTK